MRAFEASKENIEVQRKQIDAKFVDLTWIFAQSLFMAINTVLWALSYAEIRQAYPRGEVRELLDKALETAFFCSLKWPGVEGAIELYGTLQHTCLKAYDGDPDQSYTLASPINRPSPATTASPEPLSSPMSSEFNQSHMSSASGPPSPDGHRVQSLHKGATLPHVQHHHSYDAHLGPSDLPPARPSQTQDHSAYAFDTSTFDPATFDNPLPPVFNPHLARSPTHGLFSPLYQPYTSNMGFGSGHDFVLSGSWQASQPMFALSLQQQAELMDKLEVGRIDGILG